MKNYAVEEAEMIMSTRNQTETVRVTEPIDYSESPLKAAVKRTFDMVVAAGTMVVFSPIYLAIVLMIRHQADGPALFKQERIGRGGKPFNIYKFRTMRTDAEKDGVAQLCHENDERLTKVGRFLRAHHLDELPQLWNVFKGDMSLVGYRPERQCFIDKIMEQNPDYRYLYNMRPGVFSRATLENGYTDTIEKMLIRLDMDLEYLQNHNLLVDIKIIFQTFWSIVSGKKF